MRSFAREYLSHSPRESWEAAERHWLQPRRKSQCELVKNFASQSRRVMLLPAAQNAQF